MGLLDDIADACKIMPHVLERALAKHDACICKNSNSLVWAYGLEDEKVMVPSNQAKTCPHCLELYSFESDICDGCKMELCYNCSVLACNKPSTCPLEEKQRFQKGE